VGGMGSTRRRDLLVLFHQGKSTRNLYEEKNAIEAKEEMK
jgi:hypothetical protein